MLTMIDLLESVGITPRRVNSKEFSSRCPACGGVDRPGDPSDRFRTWPDGYDGGNSWCRMSSCGWKGDTIQFCRDFKGMDFKEACEHVGRTVAPRPAGERRQSPQLQPAPFTPHQPNMPCDTWLKRAKAFVAWAHQHLLNSPAELAYLDGRGLPLSAVRHFRLGYNPGERGGDIYRNRSVWGLPVETKEDGSPKKLWVPRGIVIPVFAEHAGELVPARIRIRRPKEHLRQGDGNKYVVIPGSSRHTLCTDQAAKAFVIVEAELDAMLIGQAMDQAGQGVAGAVALGSLGHKPDAQTHALLQNAMAVLVALDFEPPADPAADPAKTKNLLRTYSWWQQHYPNAERWPVPVGKDPGDAYIAGCDICSWVLAGVPPVLRPGVLRHGRLEQSAFDPGLPGGCALSAPAFLTSKVRALSRHMSTHGITLRRSAPSGLLLPVAGKSTPSSAMDEIIFLIPSDLAAWLKGLELDEVTAEILGERS